MAVYLDYNASAPIDPRVLDYMIEVYRTHFGNADSRTHIFGTEAKELVNHSRRTSGPVPDDIREGTVVGFENPGKENEKVLIKLDGKYPMPLFVCAKKEMRLYQEAHLNTVPSLAEAEERFGWFPRLDTDETGNPTTRYYVLLHLPKRVSGPLFKGEDPIGGYAVMVDDQDIPFGKVFLAVWPSMQSFDDGDRPAQLFDTEQLLTDVRGQR